MKVHELKSWPAPFAAVKSGAKRFEVRPNDRGFRQGDVVLLREFRPLTSTDAETGREILGGLTGEVAGPFMIGHISEGAYLPEGWCGFELLELHASQERQRQDALTRLADAVGLLAGCVNTGRGTLQIDDVSHER